MTSPRIPLHSIRATDVGGSIINVGWVRHAVGAVTHRMCRQALIKKCVVLLRNVWWVTQKPLTHPTFITEVQSRHA